MATITTAGLEYIAKFFNDAESTAIINKIRIGSGITAEAIGNTDLATKYTDLGFEEATASTIEYLNTTAHPRTLHLRKTFTSSATVNRSVWECGAFTSAGVCVMRHVFSPYELYNSGIILPSGTITIDIYLRFDGGTLTYATDTGTGTVNFRYTGNVAVGASVVGTNDSPSTYTCQRGKVCFNGLVLPGASPANPTIGRGGNVWSFRCYSEDMAKIQEIVGNAAIVSSGVSVTGQVFATSLQQYGTLKIWNKTTITHDTYNNCLMEGPVTLEPFGVGWWFELTIYQSYYGATS